MRLPETGLHRIRILNALGREVYSTAAQGGADPVVVHGLQAGVHIIGVESPDGVETTRRVGPHLTPSP